MGLDRTTHLEPFIKIPVQYEEYEREIKTCGEHENHKGDKFCPICGKEIKNKKVQNWIKVLMPRLQQYAVSCRAFFDRNYNLLLNGKNRMKANREKFKQFVTEQLKDYDEWREASPDGYAEIITDEAVKLFCQPAVMGWISAEKTPTDEHDVLICTTDNYIGIGWYYDDSKEWAFEVNKNTASHSGIVAYWMEIPARP